MRWFSAAFGIAVLLLPWSGAAADDDADLRATAYFKSCDAADFAEPQCLCFARHFSHSGRGIDPALLLAMEETFTLGGKDQVTIPAVRAALGHRSPPINARDEDINAATIVLVKTNNSCAHAQ